MDSRNTIAFGSKFTKLVEELGIKPAGAVLTALATGITTDELKKRLNQPPYLPSLSAVKSFISTQVGAKTLVTKTLQDRLLPPQEKSQAPYFANQLPEKDRNDYWAYASLQLFAETNNLPAEKDVIDLYLFLCNERRKHDGK